MGLKKYDIIHFIIGLIVGSMNAVNPIISLQGTLIFIAYEFLEQFRVFDKSYRDVLAFGLGWGVSALLL